MHFYYILEDVCCRKFGNYEVVRLHWRATATYPHREEGARWAGHSRRDREDGFTGSHSPLLISGRGRSELVWTWPLWSLLRVTGGLSGISVLFSVKWRRSLYPTHLAALSPPGINEAHSSYKSVLTQKTEEWCNIVQLCGLAYESPVNPKGSWNATLDIHSSVIFLRFSYSTCIILATVRAS